MCIHVCYIRAKTTGGRWLFLQFQSIQSNSGSTGGCASLPHSDKQCEMALTLSFNLSRRPSSSSIVIKQLSKLCKVGFSKLLWPKLGTRRAAAVHCDRLTEVWPRAIFFENGQKMFRSAVAPSCEALCNINDFQDSCFTCLESPICQCQLWTTHLTYSEHLFFMSDTL